MQIRALRTFNSAKYGLIREGMVVTVDNAYGGKLISGDRPLAKLIIPDDNKALPGPDRNKARVDAGNEQRDEGTAASSQHSGGETKSELEPESGETDNSSEDPPAGGRRRRSSSPRRGLRSPKSK